MTGLPRRAADIGVFDERGIAVNGRGFRGWSGGFRTRFSVAADQATPGYLPGPVGRGRWHVALGPYQVSPQGLDCTVTVTLTLGPQLVVHARSLSRDALGAGSVSLPTTAQRSAHVRAGVRHPRADGSPGNGNAVADTVPLGPMAAMSDPVWLGH